MEPAKVNLFRLLFLSLALIFGALGFCTGYLARGVNAAAPLRVDTDAATIEATATVARSDGGHGSAVVITAAPGAALLLTAAHVLAGDDKLLVHFVALNLRSLPAEVIRRDDKLDLALLKVSLPVRYRVPVASLCELPLHPFDAVVSVGAAAGMDPFPTAGIVGNARLVLPIEDDQTVEVLQHSASIVFGSSGGPLFDAHRRCVAGINVRLRASAVGFSMVPVYHIGFAVPADIVRRFLEAPT